MLPSSISPLVLIISASLHHFYQFILSVFFLWPCRTRKTCPPCPCVWFHIFLSILGGWREDIACGSIRQFLSIRQFRVYTAFRADGLPPKSLLRNSGFSFHTPPPAFLCRIGYCVPLVPTFCIANTSLYIKKQTNERHLCVVLIMGGTGPLIGFSFHLRSVKGIVHNSRTGSGWNRIGLALIHSSVARWWGTGFLLRCIGIEMLN